MRFLYKIPLIKSTILAWNDDSVRKRSNCWANNRSNKRFKKNSTFFLISFDFLKQTWLQQSYSGSIIYNNKVLTRKTFIIFVLVFTDSTLLRVLITIFLHIWKWDCMYWSKIDIFKPSFNAILVIIESNWTVWWPHN